MAQALIDETEQLTKLAHAQKRMTRILESERRHRERLAGVSYHPALPMDEPIDEEVTALIAGITEEVGIIGVLCDTLAIAFRACTRALMVAEEIGGHRAHHLKRSASSRLSWVGTVAIAQQSR